MVQTVGAKGYDGIRRWRWSSDALTWRASSRSVRRRTLIRQATVDDTPALVDTLIEAANWVRSSWTGRRCGWKASSTSIASGPRSRQGLFVVAEVDGHIVGAMRFQLEDRLFWPDLDGRRFRVRASASRCAAHMPVRAFRRRSCDGPSSAPDRSASDTCASIAMPRAPRLRGSYERLGFRLHSFRQVGRLLRVALRAARL